MVENGHAIEFPWQRRWLAQPPHIAEDKQSVQFDATEQFTLEQISDRPCLVLLGAPGIGKTHEIKRSFARSRELGEPAIFVILSKIRDYSDIEQSILGTISNDNPIY